SEELSEAVSVFPITQGLTSSWEPNSSSPPALTFDPDPTSYDPWHVHLGLHRRSCPRVTVQLTVPSSETTNSDASSRRSLSSSEVVASDPPSSSRETSPCREEGSSERSRGDLLSPVQVSDSLKQIPSDGSEADHLDGSLSDSQEMSAAGSLTSSDGGLTPVTSVTSSPDGSTSSLHEDLKENQSAGRKDTNGLSRSRNTSTWSGSRKFSAPALRFTRQLSVGGAGSSMGVHHNQSYHPFPNRKTPRISEAARRLGMYSSF
ncbi:hypothetical protein L3Q82_018392, partial [Scortum barcoo]